MFKCLNQSLHRRDRTLHLCNGRKEGRKEGRKDGREEGRKEDRKE